MTLIGHEGGNPGHRQGPSYRTTAPVLDPTYERLGVQFPRPTHRYCLSFRDVEDLLAERGIIVSYETIRQWCGKFGPDYARRLKRRQGRLGDTWFWTKSSSRSTVSASLCGAPWTKTVT